MSESLFHPLFGDLKWEPDFSWWFTQIRLASGEWLDVILDPGDDESSAFLERAAPLYLAAMEAERMVLAEAVRQRILELYEHWRQEDEPKLTAEELKDRLELIQVRVDAGDDITLSYVLGDVFGGHSVQVMLNEQLQVQKINLVG
jgi:hypothetical protein